MTAREDLINEVAAQMVDHIRESLPHMDREIRRAVAARLEAATLATVCPYCGAGPGLSCLAPPHRSRIEAARAVLQGRPRKVVAE